MKDPGTSILVMGFYDAASDEPDNLVRTAEELERAAAENFWPAIISNLLKVSIRIQNGRNEVYDIDVDPEKHVPDFVDAYRKNKRHEIVENLEEVGDVVRKIVTLTIPDREKPPEHETVDHEAVLIVRRASTDSGNNNVVHFYRGRHMVVMEKNLGSLVFGGMPFKAFVECGLAAGDSELHENGEMFLRTAEPPAHDKWHLTSELKNDYALGSGARLRDFFNEIKTEIADLIKPTYEGDDTGPKVLSRLLRLSEPDGPTSVPKVRVDQDSSYVADDGGWMIEADIYLPENKEWKISPVLKFDAETGGGSRVSWALEAVDNCSVVGGDLIIPDGVRTAKFRGKSDPNTHPAPAEDTAVKVVLHRIRS